MKRHLFLTVNVRGKESGVALVLTLAILVIATIVVTAFFFRSRYDAQGSGSYSSQITSKKLAELGAAQVTASFMAEAVAGAAEILGEGTADQKLLVDNAKYMVPQQKGDGGSFRSNLMADPDPANLSADPYFTVVRQSVENLEGGTVNGKAIFGGLKVSGVNTKDPAVNRSGLDGKFWGKPMLTSQGANSFADDDTPNWIYVSANGTTLANKNTAKPGDSTFLVGRYAFNVYDVGGLLDANIAGFTAGGAVPQLARRKGSLIFADLSELATNLGVALSPAQVAQLNEWRYNGMEWNATAGIPNDKLDVLLKSGAMLASLGKFTPGITGTIGRLNKNAFFSREDMIRYFASVLDPGDPAMPKTRILLPYLTHFTRDINQPTFWWNWTKSGRPQIAGAFNSIGKVPADIEKINSEPWDGMGRMRVPRRFPLDRLDLLKLEHGAPVGDATLIQRYFGLRWDSNHWVYDPLPVAGPNTEIRSLMNVNPTGFATPGMEPNFFELLSAAINCGSLGQQFGGVIATIKAQPNRPHSVHVKGSKFQTDGQVDSHVMRIGAAIIDQWDSDSFPTEILFNGRTIFGVEDIPYLHGFKRMNYIGGGAVNGKTYIFTFNSTWNSAPDPGPPSMQVVEAATLIHPQVWNPHSAESGTPTEAPTAFRVVPYINTLPGGNNPITTTPVIRMGTDLGRKSRVVSIGDINGSLRYDLYVSSSVPGLPGGLNWDTQLPDLSDEDHLVFSGNAATFREPILLWKPTSTNTEGSVSIEAEGGATQTFTAKLLTYTDPAKPATDNFVGFRIGKFLTQNTLNPAVSGNLGFNQCDWVQYKQHLNSDVRVNFALQYSGPNGWQTYDIMYDTVDFPSTDGMDSSKKAWRVVGSEFDATYRVDPRVERFGPQSQFYRTSPGNPANSASNVADITGFPPNSTGMDSAGKSWSFYNFGGGDAGSNSYNAGLAGAGQTARWKNTKFGGNAQTGANYWPMLSTNKSTAASEIRYLDPDSFVRPASGADTDNPLTPGNKTNRPVILNRKFQSVAEMGYACRDLPWKSVDFWNSNSGDAALMDYFCLHETDSDPTGSQVVSGVLNINSANPRVLASLISGASTSAAGTDQIGYAAAKKIADKLAEWTHADPKAGGPFRSRADIVGSWNGSAYVGPFTGSYVLASTGTPTPFGNSDAIKGAVNEHQNSGKFDVRRANLLRALVDTSTVRTWNLMIDVVAQTGKIRPTGDLKDFVVDGQTRNWVFVSIDRMTGKIVDMKTESAD